MQRTELAHWLRLTLTKGVGNETARQLLTQFGLPENIFAQTVSELTRLLGPSLARALLQEPEALQAQLARTWDWLQGQDGTVAADGARAILTLADPRYPAGLLAMQDPPPMLYLQGNARWLGATHDVHGALELGPALAIVGSRNPTPQGAVNARQFASALAHSGLCIVSGLALGVDGAAHEGALDAQAVDRAYPATIAVVGTGLDRVYPKRHLELARRIASDGLIISEYPIGTPPLAENFPRRNRIIAGLSLGTLVVEAALRSGSLITARLALEQGKEVFAIPGSIHSAQSHGCHALIRQGAKLVESAQDVLEELPTLTTGAARQSGPDAQAATAAPAPVHAAHQALLQALGYDPVGLDALQARTGLDTAQLQAQLMTMELEGLVSRLPGGLFQRVSAA